MEERTSEAVKKEFNNLCLRAGDLQYQVILHQEELARTNVKLRELHEEFKTLDQKDANGTETKT